MKLLAVLFSIFFSVVAMGKTAILIGDSISSGVLSGTSKDLYHHLLQEEKDLTIRNLSAGGLALGKKGFAGFNDVNVINTMRRIDGVGGGYDLIIIQAGTNDFGLNVHLGDTITSLKMFLDEARLKNKKVLLMDTLWRHDETTNNASGNPLGTYRLYMWYTCASNYSDVCYHAHRQNSVFDSSNPAYYDTDLIHPNVQGHRLLADWIKLEASNAGYF